MKFIYTFILSSISIITFSQDSKTDSVYLEFGSRMYNLNSCNCPTEIKSDMVMRNESPYNFSHINPIRMDSIETEPKKVIVVP